MSALFEFLSFCFRWSSSGERGIEQCNKSRTLSTRRYICKTRRILAESRRINSVISRIISEIYSINELHTLDGISIQRLQVQKQFKCKELNGQRQFNS